MEPPAEVRRRAGATRAIDRRNRVSSDPVQPPARGAHNAFRGTALA